MLRFLKGYHLDLRSLALMRITLSFFAIIEALHCFYYRDTFFSDQGFLPRHLFIEKFANPWSWSIFYMSGDLIITNILFSLGLFSLIFVLFGFKTKFFTIISWIFILSMNDRNWFIMNAGDDVLRVFYFLGIFLPWGNYFSIDHALAVNKNKIRPKIYHPASNWFLLQLVVIYFFSYLYKDHAMWRQDYTAVFYALQLDIFSTPIGKWVSEYISLTKVLTFLTIYLELLGPIILVFHGLGFKYKNTIRVTLIYFFILFHLGLIATMTIGLFPYFCISVWLGFLPTSFWDKLKSKDSLKNYIIYYDGHCSFCHKGVLLIKELFCINSLTYPAQVNNSVLGLMEKENSWVVYSIMKNKYFYGYQAFAKIIAHKQYGFIFNNPLALKVGEAIYRFIAKRRSFFSSLTSVFNFRIIKMKTSFLPYIVCLLGISTCLYWNLNSYFQGRYYNNTLSDLSRYLHLYQNWDMFSPNPKMDDTWFTIKGTFENGAKKNIFFDNDANNVNTDKAIFIKNVTNKYWRKTFANMQNNSNQARYFADFLCRHYNMENYQIEKSFLQSVLIEEYSEFNTMGSITEKAEKVNAHIFNCKR